MRQKARFVVALAIGLTGCERSSDPGPVDPSTVKDPVVLDETRISKTDPSELPRLFQLASAELLKENYDGAASEFDRIVSIDPTGPTAAPSLYNAGLSYAGRGDYSKAAERFRASAELAPSAETTKPAWIRTSRIQAYLERWTDLEATSNTLLGRGDLTVLERIEGMGAKSLALVEQGRVDEAYETIVRARNEIEDRHLGESGTPPLELAQVSFALGEIRRAKSETIQFVPVPPDFGAVLEARCTGLLDAQGAYSDAMRSLDAHWSAMAGYRVGELYQRLHRDVMAVPPPSVAKTVRQRQLWEGAMRLRFRILLEKGLKMMDGTVALGERTGESSPWITRAREAKKELAASLELEKEALAKLPFTEDEIRTALEDLKKKSPPKPP